MPYCNISNSISSRVDDLTSRLTLPELVSRLGTSQTTPNVSSVGLPEFNYRVEAIHGLEAYCIKHRDHVYCPTYFPIGSGIQVCIGFLCGSIVSQYRWYGRRASTGPSSAASAVSLQQKQGYGITSTVSQSSVALWVSVSDPPSLTF